MEKNYRYKTTFDYKMAQNLIENYNIKKAELGRWLGIKKQRIDQLLKNNSHSADWQIDNITDYEIKIIKQMIKNSDTSMIEKNLVIAIRNNKVDPIIFIRNNKSIKVIFDLPDELNFMLRSNGYHYLNERDVKYKKNLISVTRLGKHLAQFIDKNIGNQMSRYASVDLEITTEEYCQYLGYDGYCSPKGITDKYFEEIINNHKIDNNFVYISYIDHKSDYDKLIQASNNYGMNFNEMLDYFGYKNTNQLTEFESINNLLAEFKEFEGKSGKTLKKDERYNRNTTLVKKIKEMYKYKCQLCEPNNEIPLIEKEDGTYYCEVHHITELSNEDKNDDVETLDNPFNAICVCPHHHKVLHYHNGGYSTIIKINDDLFFQSNNEKNSLIKIEVDHHLRFNINT